MLSLEEFNALAAEMAPKVNLFREIWSLDPEAQFFGGTSRDFLYFLKEKLQGANSREEIMARVEALRALPMIDVRSFITQESDADILSGEGGLKILAARFAITKIDLASRDRFDPSTEVGQSELRQGYLPVEKIRLGRNGLVSSPAFGNGAEEIFTGKITAHFGTPRDFASTLYAKAGANHPVLLALRFLRQLASDYYHTHGRGYPQKLGAFPVDPTSEVAAKEVITRALTDKRLQELLKNVAFAERMNMTVQKAFRTFTNPTVALALYKRFGANILAAAYPQIEPLNQYLFAKYRNEGEIRSRLIEFKIDPAKLFVSVHEAFPDGKLYHGASTDTAFTSILRAGVLPSLNGSAGHGLYGVSSRNISFAETWRNGGKERVVILPVSPKARIVDTTRAEGKRAFAAFRQKYPEATEDEFAEAFGIDIVNSPADDAAAYVVKNSAVLARPRGYTREVLTLSELFTMAEQVRSSEELEHFFSTLEVNWVSTHEILELTKHISFPLFHGLLIPEAPGMNDSEPLDLIAHFRKIDVYTRLRRQAEAMATTNRRKFLERLLSENLPLVTTAALANSNGGSPLDFKEFAPLVDNEEALGQFYRLLTSSRILNGQDRLRSPFQFFAVEDALAAIPLPNLKNWLGSARLNFGNNLEPFSLFVEARQLRTEKDAKEFAKKLSRFSRIDSASFRIIVGRMPESPWKRRLDAAVLASQSEDPKTLSMQITLWAALEDLAETRAAGNLSATRIRELEEDLDSAISGVLQSSGAEENDSHPKLSNLDLVLSSLPEGEEGYRLAKCFHDRLAANTERQNRRARQRFKTYLAESVIIPVFMATPLLNPKIPSKLTDKLRDFLDTIDDRFPSDRVAYARNAIEAHYPILASEPWPQASLRVASRLHKIRMACRSAIGRLIRVKH